ncbi:MAG: oligopeptidase A [Nevskiales bacterium]
MSNALLDYAYRKTDSDLPPFDRIQAEQAEPAVRQILQENREAIDALTASPEQHDWDSLIRPLEELDDRLHRAFSPVSHLNSVTNTAEWRAAYNACLPLISEYSSEMGQHAGLHNSYLAVSQHSAFTQLDTAQQKVVSNALRDFHLSGIDLPTEKQTRFKQIQQRLSELSTKFEENLLDATDAWSQHFEHVEALDGLPESALAMARQKAAGKDRQGWLIGLDFPSYHAVMTYARDRSLRETLYTAFCTRASDQGPQAGQWDNREVMEEILALRHEAAQLLGFANYAERSLATKMARDPEEVVSFLRDLAQRSRPRARQELEELREFAKQLDGLDELQAWDSSYYAEKLRQQRYAISDEELRPYFPAPQAIQGLFEVAGRLYGLNFEAIEDIATWHQDVTAYAVMDASGQTIGYFYLDPYAREAKRGGAWMDDCLGRRRRLDGLQLPIAFLTCNFTPPVDGKPALLTHDEVLTLFHEFGHGLHHLLTEIDCADVAGINGVAWDAVELPSQFLENWCWEKTALDQFARHYESNEAIPADLFDRLNSTRHFHAALMMLRQIEFSLFDFLLHQNYDPAHGAQVYETLAAVREEVSVLIPPAFNRFPNSFSHIFAGGYAAGYYSYKWAEVLSADAFAAFEEEGVFNANTGERFRTAVLSRGGSQDAMDLFIAFRGREPSIEPLLRHSGLLDAA